MLIKLDGKEQDVRLRFTSTEYNCATKLVGRLKVTVNGAETWINPNTNAIMNEPHIKDGLIRELAATMVDKGTYPPLKSTSPYFPSDGGTYLPNILLYADSISGIEDGAWYTSFKSLIKELQSRDYGFKVYEMPIFSNNTYSGSFWPSRVWGIVPPAMVDKLVIPGIKLHNELRIQAKSFVGNANNSKHYRESDMIEIKEALSG